MDATTVRFGGAFGVVCAVTMLPRALVAVFGGQSNAFSAHDYFADTSQFVSPTSVIPMLHILFGLAFLGVLVAMLREASGPTPGVYTTLAGGVVFLALTAGSFAAEVAYPMAAGRYGAAPMELSEPLAVVAVWLYHFCQIGAAAMIFATSAVVWRTGVLPRWTAAAGLLGVLLLVPTGIPVPGGLPSLVWMLLIGVVMLVAPNSPRRNPLSADTATAGRLT